MGFKWAVSPIFSVQLSSEKTYLFQRRTLFNISLTSGTLNKAVQNGLFPTVRNQL